MNILLAEDQPDLAFLLTNILSSCRVVWKEDGEKALAEFQECRELDTGQAYDYIVSDNDMPVMDGVRFAREVRTLNQKIPIILWTGGPFPLEYGLFTDLVYKDDLDYWTDSKFYSLGLRQGECALTSSIPAEFQQLKEAYD